MDHECVITFDKILESPDYDQGKDSNSKQTQSFKKDLKKFVDKVF